MITRTLLGCLFALCLGFVSGCGGSTQTEVISGTDAEIAAAVADSEDYEAQMAAEEAAQANQQ